MWGGGAMVQVGEEEETRRDCDVQVESSLRPIFATNLAKIDVK